MNKTLMFFSRALCTIALCFFFAGCNHSDPYLEEADLDMDAAKNLSSDGTANCYIVSRGGLYKFKAVVGNSSTPVHGVESAAILWESFGTSVAPNKGDLIKAVCYDDGYIAFQTPYTIERGNAVIAAKNAKGKILWSWHIWFTDSPQAQTYSRYAGTMMDRNIGATTTDCNDPRVLGLLYQWGRKDPFLGAAAFDSNIPAASTITWPPAVEGTQTVQYASAYPTTFITSTHAMGGNWTATDNELWVGAYEAKTIYDPCPVGWRVPNTATWRSAGIGADWTEISHYYTEDGEYTRGAFFTDRSGSTSHIWYPCAGRRDYECGSLHEVGNTGNYWSKVTGDEDYDDTRDAVDAMEMFNYWDGCGARIQSGYRAAGYSVRCTRE